MEKWRENNDKTHSTRHTEEKNLDKKKAQVGIKKLSIRKKDHFQNWNQP